MLKAEDIKNKISDNDVYSLLEKFGGEPDITESSISSTTVCHGGDSHKLIYYRETKTFMCYTGCGSFDIFTLISKIMNCDFAQSMRWLANHFDLGTGMVIGGFKKRSVQEDIDVPLIQRKKNEEQKELTPIDDGILSVFYDKYYRGWINEGIAIESMKKFEIKYSIVENQIVIPHRDSEGNLVGIRARNLNKELVDQGKKYIPVYINGKSYKYPTGLNLYGLDKNKDEINRSHKIVLFEAEKSVIKLDSYYGKSNGVALNGTMLSENQISLINSLDVEEVVIAVDKEFEDNLSDQSTIYAKKIYSIFKRLKTRYNVSILWDMNNKLNKKDSPVDEGKEVYEKLFEERLFI